MKNNIYTYILTLTIMFGLLSCELDRSPFNTIEREDVYSSANALEALTLGNYAILKGKGIADGYSWVNNFYRFAEYPSDNVALSGSTSDPLMFIYNYKRQTTGYRKQSLWTSSYKTIVGCNTVIEGAEEGQTAEIDHMIGQNYFLRGMVYFYLTNIFGRPYNQDPASNLGVPLKLTTDVNDLPIRSSVKDCYNQVVSDLKKAEELMTIEQTASYATKEAAQALLSRVYLYMEDNESAIEYADKVINSNRYSLLSKDDFKKYPRFTPDENKETIFALRYVDGADNKGESDNWYTFPGMYAAVDAQGYPSLEGAGWGEMYASATYRDILEEWPNDARAAFVTGMVQDKNSTELYGIWYGLNMYSDTDNDELKKNNSYLFHQDKVDSNITTLTQTWTIDINDTERTFTETSPITKEVDSKTGAVSYSVTPYMINKSTGKTTQLSNPVKLRVNKALAIRNTYPKYFITKCSGQENKGHLWSPVIVRLAEVYLNKAEAYAKKGEVGNALISLNEVRGRAIGAEAAYTASDITEELTILDLVLKERRLELAYEGHRKFDVFRNGKTMERDYPGTHLKGENPYYSIPSSSVDIIEYLPEKEIQVQPDLVQNP